MCSHLFCFFASKDQRPRAGASSARRPRAPPDRRVSPASSCTAARGGARFEAAAPLCAPDQVACGELPLAPRTGPGPQAPSPHPRPSSRIGQFLGTPREVRGHGRTWVWGAWWFGPRPSLGRGQCAAQPAPPQPSWGWRVGCGVRGEARGRRKQRAPAPTSPRLGQPGPAPGTGGGRAGRGGPRDRASEGGEKGPRFLAPSSELEPGAARGAQHSGRPWHPPSASALRGLKRGPRLPLLAGPGPWGPASPARRPGRLSWGVWAHTLRQASGCFKPRVSRATGEGV